MAPRSSSLRWRTAPLLPLLIGLWGGIGRAPAAVAPAAQPPRVLRLYVFDCGILNISKTGVERYHVTTAEVGETRMPVPCFLIAHPKGTLMWDVGVIPDRLVEAQAQRGARSNLNPTAAIFVPSIRTSAFSKSPTRASRLSTAPPRSRMRRLRPSPTRP